MLLRVYEHAGSATNTSNMFDIIVVNVIVGSSGFAAFPRDGSVLQHEAAHAKFPLFGFLPRLILKSSLHDKVSDVSNVVYQHLSEHSFLSDHHVSQRSFVVLQNASRMSWLLFGNCRMPCSNGKAKRVAQQTMARVHR